MTDILKFVVGELNKSPFSRPYNLITFDSLSPTQLLNVFSDVLCVISNQGTIDLRNESPEDTALRIFTSLRIMRYRMPTDTQDLSALHAAVLGGDKSAIYEILYWLLQRVDELRERAYLARFLVPVDVPPEFAHDADIERARAECAQLMNTFKEVHSEATAVGRDVSTLDDIRQDLQLMENERETLTRKIDKIKRRVLAISDHEQWLALAAERRELYEKEGVLTQQKQEQRTTLMHVEQKIGRMQQQLRELREQTDTKDPSEMIDKLEQENRVFEYMVHDKLPAEIDAKRKLVVDLQKVLSLPAFDQKDLQQLQDKIDRTNNEIIKMQQEREERAAGEDDKVSIFRHQAAMVERKKVTCAERLQDVRAAMASAEQKVQARKASMRTAQGTDIVTNVEFRNYVNKLRAKTNDYKKKRAALLDMRAEGGVLARTNELLSQQRDELKMQLESQGMQFTNSVDTAGVQRPKTAKPNSKDVDELKQMVSSIENELNDKRKRVELLLAELKPLRDQFQTTASDYNAQKRTYETTAASFESAFANLEQEVKSMRADVNEAESECFRLQVDKCVADAMLQRAMDGNFKQIIEKDIDKSEADGAQLRMEQASVREVHEDASKQMKMWRDFAKLMEVKHKLNPST